MKSPELDPRSFRARLESVVSFAERQLAATRDRWGPDTAAPVHTRDGKWYRPRELWTDWTPGFYAGQMWILHEITGRAEWRSSAERYSRKLENRRFDRDVHDLGFVFLSTYGRWFDLLDDGDPVRDAVRDVLVTAATVQSYRWNGGREDGGNDTEEDGGNDGFIYSFNGPQSLFIDVMMNVRLLFWASRHGAPDSVLHRAIEHARTSAKYLVRRDGPWLGDEDGLTIHEAIFNTERGRGEFRCLSTQQGYSPFTCWSRGLAWAMYGFAVAHEYSPGNGFLETAERCAGYYLRHTPDDGVPFWDYGAPRIPEEPRDSSAAAVASCAFRILARLTESADRGREYLAASTAILESLTGPAYLAESGEGEEGLLLHGVYHRPRGWGVDASVMWGDYFFLEAVERALDSL